MAAFPAVLEKVPNARLVVAGANHHTKPGYWESIREAQKGNPRIDFLGYVAEDAIPDLFRSTSVVVLPYDSATGSSGPAHQACEYGVPVVSADLPDFRDMAADENMAISFYQRGDEQDLARQLIDLLESHEKQRQAAEQNYSAAVRMTMPHVVRHYLRWFELANVRRRLRSSSASRLRLWKHHSVRSSVGGLGSGFLTNWRNSAQLQGEDSEAWPLRHPPTR